MPDIVNISCRFRFDRMGKNWSLDSLVRDMNLSSIIGGSPNYVHLRQQVHIAEEYLETLFDVVPVDFLYIINRDANNIITYGRYGQTHMFKLKPNEVSFIQPSQIGSSIGIKATGDDTSVDFLTLERLAL